jgi:serine/threonine protein kinase
MYSGPQDAPTTRLLPSFRPLAYQWALHIISGLAFVHSHNVVFGDPSLAECWLASDSRFSLSLVGFANAGFNYFKEWSAVYPGERKSSMEFHPFDDRDGPTQQTDLFLWGCIVYELMTGYWPLTPEALSRQYTTRELEARVVRKEWPRLEPEYMGAIVRRCWNGEYASAEEVKAAVKTFLQGLGWEIEDNDDLKGFCATDLFLHEQQ